MRLRVCQEESGDCHHEFGDCPCYNPPTCSGGVLVSRQQAGRAAYEEQASQEYR
jgi:hypothetical protein